MIWPLDRRRIVPVDLQAWHALEAALPFLRGLEPTEQQRMREMVAAFLTSKSITGVQGMHPDDTTRLVIAAQACLPVLHLGLGHYDDFVEVVVHPSAFVVRRTITDESGLMHEFDDVLAGEAMHGGPIVLSWEDVKDGAFDDRTNIVIHEFVHKLDMADGEADGCPPLPPARRANWRDALAAAYDAFVDAVERAEASMPDDIDPEDEAADPYYAGLPLDPYAATDAAEFFAVAAEAFFVSPESLATAFPTLYSQFRDYFRQDTLSRLARA
jgi:Mlc titration factor MtfA (ptsG expression regulator)